MITVYESLLISKMLHVNDVHFVKTFEQFNDSDIKLNYMPIELKDVLLIDPKRILSEHSIMNGIAEFHKIPKNDTNIAYLLLCDIAQEFVKSADNFMNDEPIFNVLEDKIGNGLDSYMMNAHSPFAETLEPFVARVFETGLMKAWKVQVQMSDQIKSDENEFKPKVHEEKKMLTFEDMALPFYLLIVGLTSSLITFIFEKGKFFFDSKMVCK